MPRVSHTEYINKLEKTDGKPLLHTVVFESINGPDHPIEGADTLIPAAKNLGQIAGVREVRYVAPSISSNLIVEELALDNSEALQRLRTDPVHDAVVAVASRQTNWRVVDRVMPNTYDEEQPLIAAAKNRGGRPVMAHSLVTFDDSATENDIHSALGRYGDALGNANTALVLPAEVSLSLDERKGSIAIVRAAWHDQSLPGSFERSADYMSLAYDLGDIATVSQVTHQL